MQVVSVNIGAIALHTNARGQQRPTGLHKRPTEALVSVDRHGLHGDASAYRSRARGDTAVHLYSLESYRSLNTLLTKPLPIPCFGENLTVSGYPEAISRIGDVLRIGSTLLQVNQPVVRCSWPTTLAAEPRLTRWITQQGLTGLYLHTLEPGTLQVGDDIELVEQGHPDHTIAHLNRVLAQPAAFVEDAATLLQLPALAERWKDSLRSSR